MCNVFSLMLCALVSLIGSEAKPKEGDLMVYVYDFEECEFRKNSVLIF